MHAIKKNKSIIMIFVVFSFLTAGACYFLFFQSAFMCYKNAKKSFYLSLSTLNQKKLLVISDIQTQKALRELKQHHPNFYAAIESHQTVDQLLQLATNMAEKSGFSVIQAAPIILKHNNNQIAIDQIQLQLTGTYACLFYFIDHLNQSPWPYTLTELKIPHANQFNVQLYLRNPS